MGCTTSRPKCVGNRKCTVKLVRNKASAVYEEINTEELDDDQFMSALDSLDPDLLKAKTRVRGINRPRSMSERLQAQDYADFAQLRRLSFEQKRKQRVLSYKANEGELAKWSSMFRDPVESVMRGSEDLYTVDPFCQLVLKTEVSTGDVYTIAGSAGQKGCVDGLGTEARFNYPYACALDDDEENLFVLEKHDAGESNTVRLLDLNSRAVLTVGTVLTKTGVAFPRAPAGVDNSLSQLSTPSDMRHAPATRTYATTPRGSVCTSSPNSIAVDSDDDSSGYGSDAQERPPHQEASGGNDVEQGQNRAAGGCPGPSKPAQLSDIHHSSAHPLTFPDSVTIVGGETSLRSDSDNSIAKHEHFDKAVVVETDKSPPFEEEVEELVTLSA